MNTNLNMLRINKSNSEERLLKDCIRCKPSAQKDMYDRFASRMLGVCLRYIHDREEAEHVMIGGMVKVFDKLEQFQSEGSLEGWIRRIMVNESLMYIRKHKNMSLEVEMEKAELTLDYQSLESNLEAEDLLALIGELPIGYRTVFNLYAIEGYSHKEISDTLDINENTSKSQLSRARKLLQSKLMTLNKEELKTDKNGN